MKYTAILLFTVLGFWGYAQETTNYRSKTLAVKDSIVLDSVSINPSWFILKTKERTTVDTSFYHIDYPKALLTFKKPMETDSVIVDYLRFPDFLTRTYQLLSPDVIVTNTGSLDQLYKFSQSSESKSFTPFDGLVTSGSISRGVTVGNNQNAVLTSELDLQITGRLNDRVSLRASIQDANIPLQESGYSQRLDEFDQVFVELFSDTWRVRAGDVDLQNDFSYFGAFTKRVQGLSVVAKLGAEKNTEVFAAGAMVRGQFTTSQFTAQEGNQGPYKLRGPNNELFVLIVSGSETVYVNGVPLERGENKDYIIDYNAGEILFNATFPMTSEMRITVDYQFTDRNYSRLIAYGGGRFTSEKLTVNASVYSENDSKNNPLQQNLSQQQVEILSQAGDDRSLMLAPSATPEVYSENRILYKKELLNGVEAFVFSNNPDDELFSVTFTLVGDNQGNYVLANASAVNNIYEYVEPVGGIPQGNYEPVIQLAAPTKLQMAVVNARYKPSEKTTIDFEMAGSKNDLNLFSGVDDEDNDGFAAKLTLDQAIIKKDSLWNFNTLVDVKFIQRDFRNIQGLYNPEFSRDWNLDKNYGTRLISDYGNQVFLTAGLKLFNHQKGVATYQFEHLGFSEYSSGNRHILSGNLHLKKWTILTNTSILNSDSESNGSTFFRTYNHMAYSMKKSWIGTRILAEDNQQKTKDTDEYTPLSQRFNAYEVFAGYGDSTKVFMELGYKFRTNDSIRNNQLQKVNTSKTYYLDSRLIKNQHTNVSFYLNYRTLKYTAIESKDDENSLNSRVQYSQLFFSNKVQWNTVYETNSGTLPQQDFTYVEVEPGQGAYRWIDYNSNGIQELEEFELAQFQDQGKYVRVLLPNQVYIKTHQNRLSSSLTLNPQQWSAEEKGVKKFLSHFYSQTTYLVDRKNRREGDNFGLSPFESDPEKNLGLQSSFKNVLFLNRGKQHFTTSYTYLNNQTRQVLSVGYVENALKSHQLQFNHKFAESWLVNLTAKSNTSESISENFTSKNYNLDELYLNPKLTYLFTDANSFDVFYQLGTKKNTIGDGERLEQHRFGASFSFSNQQKIALNGEVNYISNGFEGNPNSPVSYQMLEGLQPGKNFTWSLLAQKKITKFLDLNLTYYGRKTETSQTIHTGTIQLKAYF